MINDQFLIIVMQTISTPNSYNYCGKTHYNLAQGKAVDAQGGEYVVIENGNSDYDYSDSWTNAGLQDYNYAYKYNGQFKLVGKGALDNMVYKYQYDCKMTWNPSTGYQYNCDKNTFKLTC